MDDIAAREETAMGALGIGITAALGFLHSEWGCASLACTSI
jgi:hypothetical protein